MLFLTQFPAATPSNWGEYLEFRAMRGLEKDAKVMQHKPGCFRCWRSSRNDCRIVRVLRYIRV